MTTEPKIVPLTDLALDAVILACADGEWCKVAMLIARTTDAARAQSIEASAQAIAARIYALVANYQLDVQGNVRRWRASNVRRTTLSPGVAQVPIL